MSITRSTTTHHTISRGAFLRGAALAAGGAVGTAGLATATGSRSGGLASASAAGGSSPVPPFFEGSVFGDALHDRADGYIASFEDLYPENENVEGRTGRVTSLNAKELAGIMSIRMFEPADNESGETFTPKVAEGIGLDEATAVRFVGDQGSERVGSARLTRTANDRSSGVLLTMTPRGHEPFEYPAGSRLCWTRLLDAKSPKGVSTAAATEMLENAYGFSFAEEGVLPVTTRSVKVFDDGLHIRGEARYGTSGPWTTWLGVALPADPGAAHPGEDGWSYLFGMVPKG